MAIKRSVIISLGGLKSSSITDHSPLGRSVSSAQDSLQASLTDNLPIRRSTLRQDGLTSQLGPLVLIPITLADNAAFQDFFSRVVSFIRNFSDTVSQTDTLAIQTSKVFAEVANFSDQINNSIGKFVQDSVQSADFGTLIAQNYTIDNTYFLEDYVGQSATF